MTLFLKALSYIASPRSDDFSQCKSVILVAHIYCKADTVSYSELNSNMNQWTSFVF